MRYGDYDNVTKDAVALKDILHRQGSDILLEVIADHVGHTARIYKLDTYQVQNITAKLTQELTNLIQERT